jgi:hypothetical protein
MSDLRESLTQSGTLYGFINTIVYAHDYNDLSNKPQINGVTLQGNKTPSDLGLVTPATEAVQSVNGETGAVVLDGNDIAYDNNNTINQQIDAVAASIPVMAVTSVNGETGDVVLDGSDIRYDADYTVSAKIASVEGDIPVVPVQSVNGETGNVVLDGDDIEYAEGVTVNDQIGTNAAAIGDLSQLTTTVKSSLVGAVNEIASYTPVYGNTASGAIATFDTSLALPLQDCTIAINGTNLTGANITRCGKNLFNFLPTTVTSSKTIASDIFLKAGTYICSFWVNNTTAISGFFQVRIGTTSIGGVNFSTNYQGIVKKAFILSEDSTVNIFVGGASAGYNFEFSNGQIEIGTTETTYEAYNGNTTAISWNDLGTVSEGTLDATTGKLTVVNGSMGAGDYQITPMPINQISGTNNVFTDTNGDTSVVYACSLKDYIDSQ